MRALAREINKKLLHKVFEIVFQCSLLAMTPTQAIMSLAARLAFFAALLALSALGLAADLILIALHAVGLRGRWVPFVAVVAAVAAWSIFDDEHPLFVPRGGFVVVVRPRESNSYCSILIASNYIVVAETFVSRLPFVCYFP